MLFIPIVYSYLKKCLNTFVQLNVKSLRWFRIWLQALSLRSDSMTRMHYDIAVILS